MSPIRAMGIRADDRWQGIALAELVTGRTRLEPKGRDLVYVEFLETAPWNLLVTRLNQGGEYGGVGRQLVAAMSRLSELMQLGGRLALHSLPQADGFYRRCHMTDLGPDARKEGLRYFELDEKGATALLERRKA